MVEVVDVTVIDEGADYGLRSAEFFDDFESWTARLAVQVLVDDALADEEIARSMRKERIRIGDVRKAVLGDESVLARVRIEQDRLVREGRIYAPTRRLRSVPLAQVAWLALVVVMGAGYLSLLRFSWFRMPPHLQFFAIVGFIAVLALSGGILINRAPALVGIPRSQDLGRLLPHERHICLGDRRMFMLNEIVIPAVREFIRSRPAVRYGTKLSYTGISGLYEEDGTENVLTVAARRLRRIIERADSGAVALAGYRGVGKTTSIRAMQHGLLNSSEFVSPPLVVMASAPADYDARDFVLHLYALLCNSVISRIDGVLDAVRPRGHLRRLVGLVVLAAGCVGGAVLLWGSGIAQSSRELAALVAASVSDLPNSAAVLWVGQPPTHLIALGLLGLAGFGIVGLTLYLPWSVVVRLGWRRRQQGLIELLGTARKQLAQTRFLQTHTTGWAGKLTMPLKGEASRTWSLQRAEQQLTHPEVVDKLRRFAEASARTLRTNRITDRMVIAIDELDKIGEQEKAQQFINDIKGVFGVPGCLFFVSVSDDAVLNFEQRRQGVRDAFDSAFADIVRLESFTLDESRLWVAQRLAGVPEQFCYLCHCLSGGLPRDLRRYTTDMVDITISVYQPSLALVAEKLVRTELVSKMHALSREAITLGSAPENVELTARLRAVSDAASSLELIELSNRLAREGTEKTDSPLNTLRWHGGSFALFAATILETFTNDLDEDDLTSELHQFAIVRRHMAVHPQLAWQPLLDFRKERGLDTPVE